MSDTDDGFDEEAVRQELREKYGDDDRGETERMSELLLQGATMTNQHCDACGSPIFRYDGQAFCPNCQQAGGQQADSQQQAGGQQQPADSQQTGSQQADDRTRAGGQQSAGRQADDQQSARQVDDRQAADADATVDETDASAARHAASDADRPSQPSQTDSESGAGGRERSSGSERAAGADQPAAPDRPGAADQAAPARSGERQSAAPSGEAADALESSVAALARRAAGSDDPRTAREYLEAAREAAEALAALRRNA